jgi:hypothetical protein
MSVRPPRLETRVILAEVVEELFTVDRGLPFTLGQLLRHPGSSIRRYVEWRDPRMVRPFRLALGALAFTALAFALAGAAGGFAEGFRAGMTRTREWDPDQGQQAASAALDWLLAHLQWLLLIVWVPATGEAINRAYRPLGLNLAEQSAVALYALVPILLLAGVGVLLPLPGLSTPSPLVLLSALLPSLWAAWVVHRYARPERLSAGRMVAFVFLQWLFGGVLLLFAATVTLVLDLFWLRG